MFAAAAAVTTGVTSSAVRVSTAETLSASKTLPTTLEALWRMSAASHVEATGTVTANPLRLVSSTLISAAKEMGVARALCLSLGARKTLAGEILPGERRPARKTSGRLSPKFAALET